MSAWIKMRTDLRDDPRIIRTADLLSVPDATVIGAYFILWAYADTHSTNGALGLPPSRVDKIVGVEGFAKAAAQVTWLEVGADGLCFIPRFNTHNGQSAKKRAVDASRKAAKRSVKVPRNVRDLSASRPLGKRTENGHIAELDKSKSKRRENPPKPPLAEATSPQPDASSPKPREGDEDFTISPGGKRLLWTQIAGIYAAYPTPHRGSKGEFMRAVAEAWSTLEAGGASDPARALLDVTRAYAASWTGKRDGGRFTVNPRRFFAHDGVWTQDPRDWAEPKTGEPAAQSERQRTAWGKVSELKQKLSLTHDSTEPIRGETPDQCKARLEHRAQLVQAIERATQAARECSP